MYATLLHSASAGVNHSKVPDRRGIPLQPFRNVRRMVVRNAGRRWTPVEDGKHKVQDVGRAIEHRLPDSPNPPPWMDTLSKLAVGAALVYGLQQLFFKEAPKQASKAQEATKEVGQKVAEELQLLGAQRMLLAVESMDQGTLDKLFGMVDANHDGQVDLRELTLALGKLNPGLPLSEAKDSATDFFVLFKVDPSRGLDKGHFRRLLQCWALMHMEPLHKMARDLQPAFDGPVSDVIRSQQDSATLRELDDIVRTPDRLPRYVDDRKVETAFRLWDLDQNGKVARETIVRSLLKLLLEQRCERHINAQEVLAVVSFLEVEERTGRMDLDTGEFRYVLQRFSELAKLDREQIMSGLIKLAVANEIGTGPSLDEVKERESNATQAASQGHASGRGNESGNRISLHA